MKFNLGQAFLQFLSPIVADLMLHPMARGWAEQSRASEIARPSTSHFKYEEPMRVAKACQFTGSRATRQLPPPLSAPASPPSWRGRSLTGFSVQACVT